MKLQRFFEVFIWPPKAMASFSPEMSELKYQLGRHAYDNAGTHFLIYFLVLFVHL
jgi:hypothetical protein